MTDLTLEDLVSTPEPDPTEVATEAVETVETTASDEAGGEWLLELWDRMDEKGMIEPLLFGPEAGQQGPREQAQPQHANPIEEEQPISEETEASQDGSDLDADDLAQFGKMVIDYSGDLQISEIVKMAEREPETVNMMINRVMDD